MNSLNSRIQGIEKPNYSTSLSRRDRETLAIILEASRRAAMRYDGDFRAPWLLSSFHSNEWVTRNKGKEEIIDGAWTNCVRVDWNFELVKGVFLTSPKYETILNLNKRISFYIRSQVIGGISSPTTWKAIILFQIQLTRWLVINETQFKPHLYGFKLINQNAIQSLLRQFTTGGWEECLGIAQGLLESFYLKAFDCSLPHAIKNHRQQLPSAAIKGIEKYLDANNFYIKVPTGPNKGKKYLSRDKISTLVNLPARQLSANSRINTFLRQFEPDFHHPHLQTRLNQRTEFPDQKTGLIDSGHSSSAEGSVASFCSNLSLIFSAYSHETESIPSPEIISLEDAQREFDGLTRNAGHNLFIPIDTGLHYLNAAMRLVHSYGDAIVDCTLTMFQRGAKGARLESEAEKFNLWCAQVTKTCVLKRGGKSISLSDALGVHDFQNLADVNFARLRNSPTLLEIQRVLIGACVVCIALLKPSRENELGELNRDCLYFGAGGYFLRQHFGKRLVGGRNEDGERPIPAVTAKAIQLLQKLGSGLASIFNDSSKKSKKLFYLPKQLGLGPMHIDSTLLNEHLDIFCDYVGIAPDAFGRRWYVRVHEMRKWFLLLFFWSGRFDVLDAARWIAGHSDAGHIFAYIAGMFPGESLPKLEAEYAVSRLAQFELFQSRGLKQESGVAALYQTVLSHFQVKSLELIPDSEWNAYVSELRQHDDFYLQPHTIRSRRSKMISGIEVSFVLREKSK